MNKILIAAAFSLAASGSLRAVEYAAELDGIISEMASTNRQTRLGATNRIDALSASLSDGRQLATCKLLKAKLRSECADIMDGDEVYDHSAYADATNLCLEVMADFANDRESWHAYGAAMLVALPLSIDRRHGEMFEAARDALSLAEGVESVSVETNAWVALFGSETLDFDRTKDALRTIAAAALSLSDASADVSAYTNGLPPQAVEMINSIRRR